MEITCLITAVPVGGESLEIEFHSTLEALGGNISYVLAQTNNRLREVNLTIIEDMKAKESLTSQQYDALMTILTQQFPYTHPNQLDYKASSSRILVRKMTNHKEQIALRAAGEMNGPDLQKTLISLLDITSGRMIETNTNDMLAYDHLKSIPAEDQIPIQMILDVLYERAEPNVVANRLVANKEKAEGYL